MHASNKWSLNVFMRQTASKEWRIHRRRIHPISVLGERGVQHGRRKIEGVTHTPKEVRWGHREGNAGSRGATWWREGEEEAGAVGRALEDIAGWDLVQNSPLMHRAGPSSEITSVQTHLRRSSPHPGAAPLFTRALDSVIPKLSSLRSAGFSSTGKRRLWDVAWWPLWSWRVHLSLSRQTSFQAGMASSAAMSTCWKWWSEFLWKVCDSFSHLYLMES